MLESENSSMAERVYDLERQVLEQQEEILSLKSTLSEVLRRLNILDCNSSRISSSTTSSSSSYETTIKNNRSEFFFYLFIYSYYCHLRDNFIWSDNDHLKMKNKIVYIIYYLENFIVLLALSTDIRI